MLSQAIGKIVGFDEGHRNAQIVYVRLHVDVKVAEEELKGITGARRAINYVALAGRVEMGDEVLLNTTAQNLNLGTGGYDFVMANLSHPADATFRQAMLEPFRDSNASHDLEESIHKPEQVVPHSTHRSYHGEMELPGHIMKGRYTPFQQALGTLEEMEYYAEVWEKQLDGFPVLVGQLHSQIAPAAAGLHLSGKTKVAYIMTDQAALPLAFSKLVRELKAAELLHATLTCGQAFGGDYETVTLHSALLAAKYILHCDAAIVCQGPGNAGTGTRYGFSGIEQARNLDTTKALGGTAIAIVRMSSADQRERHQGISHHTRTTLELAYARCVVPLPAGTDDSRLPPGHDVRFVEGAQSALDLLAEKGIAVTTMGRSPAEDPAYFLAAAAAGMVSTTDRTAI